jgi:hypothetical protein
MKNAGSQSSNRRRAIVVGGSMSGLFAGLLLRRVGFEVDIYERVDSELSGRGAGIVAQPVVAETLRGLGIEPVDLGVNMTTRKVLDAEGRIVCEFECPQTLTAWERMYRILRDAFPAGHYPSDGYGGNPKHTGRQPTPSPGYQPPPPGRSGSGSNRWRHWRCGPAG